MRVSYFLDVNILAGGKTMTVLEGTWEEIVAHASELAGRRVRLMILSVDDEASASILNHAPSARELMKMTPEERNRILSEQAAKAESLYRSTPELTDFEA